MELQKTNTVPFIIRPALAEDLFAIETIEKIAFPDPWTRQMIHEEFNNPLAISLVAKEFVNGSGIVRGYCFSWLIYDTIEIHSIAVDPDHWRRGIGRSLVSSVIQHGEKESVALIFLEVRAGNTQAIGLYETLDFARDGVRRGYYHDGEDAVLMSRRVSP